MDYNEIRTAMQELDEDSLLELINGVMSGDGDALEALNACQTGMEEVGRLFEEGEYFVGDLIYAGEIMTQVLDTLKPALAASEGGSMGKLIICTVRDDLHDIGKNIVKSLLEASGFEVVDLGIDTSAEKIIETVKAEGIKIIALSGVLTLSLDSMREIVEEIEKAGMRSEVKIVVGGAPVNENAFKNIGADAWANSPQKTVSICREWAKGE